jgi:hypothetical protein
MLSIFTEGEATMVEYYPPHTLTRGHQPDEDPPAGFPKIKIYSAYLNFIWPMGKDNLYLSRSCYFDRDREITEGRLRNIIAGAVATLSPDMPPQLVPGTSFRRRSYLAFVLPGTAWQFKTPPIEFFNNENYSFFSGKSYKEAGYSAFHCVNHMRKSEAGASPEPNEVLRYDYRLHVEPRGHVRIDDASQTLDGSGTNMGPPVSPPSVED